MKNNTKKLIWDFVRATLMCPFILSLMPLLIANYDIGFDLHSKNEGIQILNSWGHFIINSFKEKGLISNLVSAIICTSMLSCFYTLCEIIFFNSFSFEDTEKL